MKLFYDINVKFGGPVTVYEVSFSKRHSDVINGNSRTLPVNATSTYCIDSVRADELPTVITQLNERGYRIDAISPI